MVLKFDHFLSMFNVYVIILNISFSCKVNIIVTHELNIAFEKTICLLNQIHKSFLYPLSFKVIVVHYLLVCDYSTQII